MWAVDRGGNLYVIHEGKRDLVDHPAIFVFDKDGRYMRSFGSEFQGGGHGLEIRQEPDGEFLYVTGYQHLKKLCQIRSARGASLDAKSTDGIRDLCRRGA